MDITTIVGIILMLLVVVWFVYETIAFIRTLKKRIIEKKLKKEIDKNDNGPSDTSS